MKKLLAILLALMLMLSITACGNDADVENTTENTSTEDTAVKEPKNILLDAELKIGDVLNGSNEKIGEYAYIEVEKENAKNLSMEEYDSFCDSIVKDSGYNWVTIDFKDGTGLQFQGSMSTVATYGNIDSEKCISESIGMVISYEQDVYEYSPNE